MSCHEISTNVLKTHSSKLRILMEILMFSSSVWMIVSVSLHQFAASSCACTEAALPGLPQTTTHLLAGQDAKAVCPFRTQGEQPARFVDMSMHVKMDLSISICVSLQTLRKAQHRVKNLLDLPVYILILPDCAAAWGSCRALAALAELQVQIKLRHQRRQFA